MLWPNKNFILTFDNSCCTIFILILLVNTGHANLDFKFSMYRMLFLLALKKVQMVKNTPCHILTTQQKISLAKFLLPQLERRPYPLVPYQNQWISHLHKKSVFWENWLILALLLSVVFHHANVFHKKSLEQIMRCKIA